MIVALFKYFQSFLYAIIDFRKIYLIVYSCLECVLFIITQLMDTEYTVSLMTLFYAKMSEVCPLKNCDASIPHNFLQKSIWEYHLTGGY